MITSIAKVYIYYKGCANSFTKANIESENEIVVELAD